MKYEIKSKKSVTTINWGVRCFVPTAKTRCQLPERAREKNCLRNSKILLLIPDIIPDKFA